MSNTSKKLILIDGNAIIHRSYHALPPFTTKKGELVNAVYGFASTVISIIAKFQPEYIIATYMKQIISAVMYCHKTGIVHRLEIK